MKRSGRLLLSLATVLVAFIMSSSVYAACSSPAGLAGQQVYATNLGLMMYCDGTNWVSMSSGGALSGASVTPAGADKSVQFNTGGALDADANYFGYDKTNHRLGVGMVTPTMTLHVSGTFVVSTTTSPTMPGFMIGSSGYASVLSLTNVYGSFPSGLYVARPANVWGPIISAAAASQADLTLLNSNNIANRRGFQILNLSNMFSLQGMTDAGVAGASFVTMDPALGSVGISNTLPIATLDVGGNISTSGVLQVSGSSLTCGSAINGAIRWSSSVNSLQICNSSGWVNVVSNSLASASIGGATTQVEFNSSTVFGGNSKFTYTSATGRISATTISATNISGTDVQLGNGGACSASSQAGKIRYSGTQIEYCDGSAWTALSIAGGGSGTLVFGKDYTAFATNITYNGYTGTNTYTLPSTPPSNTWAIILTVMYVHTGNNDHGYWSFNAYQNGFSGSRYRTTYTSYEYDKYLTLDQRDILVPWNGAGSNVIAIETNYSLNTNPLNYFNLYYGGYIAGSPSADNLGNHTATQTLNLAGFNIQAVGLITGTTASPTNHYGQYASYTTIYNPGSFSGNAIAANTVSTTYTSTSMVALTSTSLACTSSISGTVRFNPTSNTLQICAGSAGWVSALSNTTNMTISGTLTVSSTNQTSSNPSLYVSSSAKVGIGTNNPSEAVDLNGGNIASGYELKSCNAGVCSYSGGRANLACSAGKQVLTGGCDCQGGSFVLRGMQPTVGSTSFDCICGASGADQASAAIWIVCANMK